MHTLEQLRTGQLSGVQRLQLACGLTDFPREIFSLADTLEILDLSGNALSSLPDDLPRLHKLRIIFCSDNQFVALPEVLGRCPQLSMIGFRQNRIRHVPARALPPLLRWLVLTGNELESLPAEIGGCTQLQKLMLAANRLTTLPPELANCKRLELLRIPANRLTSLPDWLLALPRLSWLAYAGNPFCEAREATVAPIAGIDWDALQLHDKLGEGASGVIYRAERHHAGGTQPLAVKVFKGAVTSDGLPRSEMAACIAAAGHPNLIPLEGKLRQHPAGADGLVMGLIDPAFRNLAGPPSLASCTRDVYPDGASFEVASLLGIARGIASAAVHLHRMGVMHGDLYGHNILHRAAGEVLLGDLGAASFLPPDASQAAALQRLEVRAFACLLEELLERCQAAPALLTQLKNDCMHADVAARPLFADIEQTLSQVAGV